MQVLYKKAWPWECYPLTKPLASHLHVLPLLLSTTLLQVLRQARQYMALPANAVADVLVMAVQHEGAPQTNGMAVTSDLLVMWQQLFPADWAQRLTSEAAATLAVMLNRHGRRSEAAGIFESRVESGQVCTLVTLCIGHAGTPRSLVCATKKQLSVWYRHKIGTACVTYT